MPISKALALLSVPESDRIEFAEQVDAEHISVRELEEKIREREAQVEALQKDIEDERSRGDDAVRAKMEAEDLLKTQDQMLVEAKAQIAELAKLNKELENRPHEVAVETVRDEEAIQEAAKEAREKAEAEAKAELEKADAKAKREIDSYKKMVDELDKKWRAADKERSDLKKQAENTGSDADTKIAAAEAEAARIRAELEEAQRKLKASSADVAKFGVWFTQVQNDFNRMMEALREVNERDPETGEKLKRGAVTLLKNQVTRLEPEVPDV